MLFRSAGTVSKKLTISLDAMGGDEAPRIVIEGVELALQKNPDVRFLLFGDEAALAPLLREHARAAAACDVRHTEERVSMEDKPSQVLRRGRKSSMGLAISSIKEGQAQAVVSAGNTGGLMALAMYVLSTMKGIDRPAIAALWPKTEGQCVFLDMGANVEATAKQLADLLFLGSPSPLLSLVRRTRRWRHWMGGPKGPKGTVLGGGTGRR